MVNVFCAVSLQAFHYGGVSVGVERCNRGVIENVGKC